ncbi:Ubiquitin-like modifier-activating enzyme ATG7 [Leucoagaricus sp. SymC.cos]|nr:Ubiquitin-like modifier-activating enzyme ATG7 [Leucoagaricus sp. SymC.cos]
MVLVQFVPFGSVVQPGFWHALSDLKIDALKLSDDAVDVAASYTVGRSITDRETGRLIDLGCTISLGPDALDDNTRPHPGSVLVRGSLKNFNTIEEFKGADKSALFNAHAQKIWDQVLATRDSSPLTSFLLISFADLKKYKYYYWFAFPAFVAKPAWEIPNDWSSVSDHFSPDTLTAIHAALRSRPSIPPFFLIHNIQIAPVEDYESFFAFVPPEQQIVAFIDPSADQANPGWPLRNLLAYLRALYPQSTSTLRILCWRDIDLPSNDIWKSRFGVLTVPPSNTDVDPTTRPSAVGWEKNPQGKLGPRLADLAPMMDPTRLANQAVDLNLKLMRWRIIPELDLEKLSSIRCLLLGAGTLGCYVARSLMGWGVRTITLVDSGRVSFSNPVRQPLFEFEDCLNGGQPKAECAAARLKKIYPGINATGHTLAIPMPGHPIPNNPTSLSQAQSDVAKLEQLIDEHDAIFLLMDSRESRWLPTVIGAAKDKIILNAALGFDTFVVMRHGSRGASSSTNAETRTPQRLGCYYCNDIVAPTDSLTDRTLDQMCTVTRPGLAPIAAATAVELLATLTQHPQGNKAPAPPPTQGISKHPSVDDDLSSCLGYVPHQIRGYLSQFRNLNLVGAAYDKCTGCSETVLQAYEKEGFTLLLKAFNDQKYLEILTGLDKLVDEGQLEALESIDWDEDEDDGADGDGDDF